MTIASHCLHLLSQRSPRTPEDLAASCVAEGLTKARSPEAAVTSALVSCHDHAPPLPDGRFGYSLHLLEGSWITTRNRNGDRLPPSFDTALLQRLVARTPLPLAGGGGEVRSTEHADGLRGPAGWLPPERDGALLGLRIRRGALEVREVELDARAGARGRDLAARLRARIGSGRWYGSSLTGAEHEVWRALVQLVAAEPDVLAGPAAPLSELLPDLASRPEASVQLGEPTTISLPLEMRAQLQQQADEFGVPLSRWLTDQLADLAQRGPRWLRRVPSYSDSWSGYDLNEPDDGWYGDVAHGW